LAGVLDDGRCLQWDILRTCLSKKEVIPLCAETDNSPVNVFVFYVFVLFVADN
jgi:hypothetical protein